MNINLNDGKCHTLEEINNYDKKEIAKQFSEGNRALEELLLKLWYVGIETFACCKGTYEKNHKENHDPIFKIPYLAIKITPETKEKVLTFVNYILNENKLSKPDVIFKSVLQNNKSTNNMIVLERIFLTNSSCDRMFETILHACDKMILNKKITKTKNTSLPIELIEKLSDREILHPLINEISVKISRNGKTQFKIKNRLNKNIKSSINSKTIDNINEAIEDHTDVIEVIQNEQRL